MKKLLFTALVFCSLGIANSAEAKSGKVKANLNSKNSNVYCTVCASSRGQVYCGSGADCKEARYCLYLCMK